MLLQSTLIDILLHILPTCNVANKSLIDILILDINYIGTGV